LVISFIGTRKLSRIPSGMQNFMEFILEFLQDIAKTQIGEHRLHQQMILTLQLHWPY